MGAKTWMLVASDGDARSALRARPVLDRAATVALAHAMFPSEKLTQLDDGNLSSTCPPDKEIVIGCFPGVTIVACKEFGGDHPSRLPAGMLAAVAAPRICLHAMHSAVDWFAFAVWQDGQLQRALSLSPDSGIIENIGAPLAFEAPYWSGECPVDDTDDEEPAYPFAFHPLEMGEAALLALFGYQLEGMIDADALEPESIALMRFKRGKSWWKF